MGQEGRSISPGGALPAPMLTLRVKAGAKLDMAVVCKCAAESASCTAASLSSAFYSCAEHDSCPKPCRTEIQHA